MRWRYRAAGVSAVREVRGGCIRLRLLIARQPRALGALVFDDFCLLEVSLCVSAEGRLSLFLERAAEITCACHRLSNLLVESLGVSAEGRGACSWNELQRSLCVSSR